MSSLEDIEIENDRSNYSSRNEIGQSEVTNAEKCHKQLEREIGCSVKNDESHVLVNDVKGEGEANDFWKKELEAKEQLIIHMQEELRNAKSLAKKHHDDKERLDTCLMNELQVKTLQLFHIERQVLRWKLLAMRCDIRTSTKTSDEYFRDDSWKTQLYVKNQRINQLELELMHYRDPKYYWKYMTDISTKMLVDIKDWQIANLEQEIVLLKNATSTMTNSANSPEISEVIENKEKEILMKMEINKLKQEVSCVMNTIRDMNGADNNIIELLREDNLNMRERLEQKKKIARELMYMFEKSISSRKKQQSKCEMQACISEQHFNELGKLVADDVSNPMNDEPTKAKKLELKRKLKHLENYIRENNVAQLKETLTIRENKISQIMKENFEMSAKLAECDISLPASDVDQIKSDSHRDKENITMNSRDSRINYLSKDRLNNLHETKQFMEKMQQANREKDKVISEQKQQMHICMSKLLEIKNRNLKLQEEIQTFIMQQKYGAKMREKLKIEDVAETIEILNEITMQQQIEKLEKDDEQEIEKLDMFRQTFQLSINLANYFKKEIEYTKLENRHLDAKIISLEQQLALVKDTSVAKCQKCEVFISKLQKYQHICEVLYLKIDRMKYHAVEIFLSQTQTTKIMSEHVNRRNLLQKYHANILQLEMVDILNVLRMKGEYVARSLETRDASPISLIYTSSSDSDTTKDNSDDSYEDSSDYLKNTNQD